MKKFKLPIVTRLNNATINKIQSDFSATIVGVTIEFRTLKRNSKNQVKKFIIKSVMQKTFMKSLKQ